MKIVFEYNSYDDWQNLEEIYKEMLLELSHSNNSRLKMLVALNERTQKHILEELSLDSDVFVKSAVARNNKTDTTILSFLSKDESDEVKEAVASNCNTSAETLEELSENDNPKIKQIVALNPNISKKTFDKLLEDRKLWSKLIYSQYITVEILERMAKELSQEIDIKSNLEKMFLLNRINQELEKLKEQ